MARKKRHRISYVLPLASTPGGHRLGVNGLAVDHDHSILYSGGRDGVICGWDLKDGTPNSSNGAGNGSAKTRPSASFRNQIQAHTHWVNDLVLAQHNEALVSASSDVTIKVWRPYGHEKSSASTIGKHSDYVKCLARPDPNADWVASGGLDQKICVWDLGGAGQTLEINLSKDYQVNKGSIYTLCTKNNLLASGGPESVVRLWDYKSGKNITKLVGHTDNIRDILMTSDGQVLLSASSDQTVKVWDIVAGRCLHTLTMHNDSVWCLYSEDPHLSVFYSADRSGLVAKTDVRQAIEFDEGISVALCQDHESIARLVTAGDYIWTASASSSLNRWQDVDTEAEVETPPNSPQREKAQSPLSQEVASNRTNGHNEEQTNGASDDQIPYTSLLRLSVTSPHPARRGHQQNAAHSPPNIRKASEAILDADPGFVIPIRPQPDETIEGQNGLIKHIMLNDRKRVLTQDTAGEVILWDLLKCVPIRSLGKQHIEDMVPEVNSMESIANWCQVDTKTGTLAVMLEENICFDAEVYADEIEIDEKIDFREDQRINLGKWVLRNLFTTLIDEEIRRDETHRQSLRSETESSASLQQDSRPGNISLPSSDSQGAPSTPGAATTPRATNGMQPTTPGLPIGLASPGLAPTTQFAATNGQSNTADDGSALETSQTWTSVPPSTPGRSSDYFASKAVPPEDPSDAPKGGITPVPEPPQPAQAPAANPTSPVAEEKEEKKKSTLFGKKFRMDLSKTLGRKSADAKQINATASAEENKAEEASDKSSEKGDESKAIEDNFYGVVQRIRQDYKDQMASQPDRPINMGITPSLPTETPVLKPPPHTMVIIQEDNPEAGGLVDMYRGEIGNFGQEADVLEKTAPMWLGELLLKNQIPLKEPVKVSFILHPHPASNPPLLSLAAPDGNARLNANRMLRAKKILAYVAERVEPPSAAKVLPSSQAEQPPSQGKAPEQQQQQEPSTTTTAAAAAATDSQATTSTEPAPTTETSTAPSAPPLKPEEYLDLYCQDVLVPIDMTLNTLRVHVWRTGGDVVLYYKAKEEVWRKMRGEIAEGGGEEEKKGEQGDEV